jgi:hypothetical protein
MNLFSISKQPTSVQLSPHHLPPPPHPFTSGQKQFQFLNYGIDFSVLWYTTSMMTLNFCVIHGFGAKYGQYELSGTNEMCLAKTRQCYLVTHKMRQIFPDFLHSCGLNKKKLMWQLLLLLHMSHISQQNASQITRVYSSLCMFITNPRQ